MEYFLLMALLALPLLVRVIVLQVLLPAAFYTDSFIDNLDLRLSVFEKQLGVPGPEGGNRSLPAWSYETGEMIGGPPGIKHPKWKWRPPRPGERLKADDYDPCAKTST